MTVVADSVMMLCVSGGGDPAEGTAGVGEACLGGELHEEEGDVADGEGAGAEGPGATGARQGDRASDPAAGGRQPGSQGGV